MSRDTQGTPESHQAFVYRAFTVCGRPSQGVPLRSTQSLLVALLPRPCLDNAGLGYSAFARHYLRNHFCFLFLRVLRCFSSPRSLPFRDGRPSACRVAPFGHPGINGCLRLRPAFRSLPRPSSPPGAKASTVCPSLASLRRRNSSSRHAFRARSLFRFSFHHVKDLLPHDADLWRITDSNR